MQANNNSKSSKQQAKKDKQLRKQQEQTKKEEKEEEVEKEEREEQQDQVEQLDGFDMNQIQEVAGQENVEVDFLIAELNMDYYHSLKTILLKYSQLTKTTNSELADAVLNNLTIGNISIADDDEDQDDEDEDEQEQGVEQDEENVYSVLTILPGNAKVVQNIKKVALQSAAKQGDKAQVMDLIKLQSTGVVINDRLPNLPPFIANSYHEVFKGDMAQLKKKDKKKYSQVCSGHLLIVSEVQVEGGKKSLDSLIYSQFQNYEMCKHSVSWWVGDRNQSLNKKAALSNLYCVISAENYFRAIDSIKDHLE